MTAYHFFKGCLDLDFCKIRNVFHFLAKANSVAGSLDVIRWFGSEMLRDGELTSCDMATALRW